MLIISDTAAREILFESSLQREIYVSTKIEISLELSIGPNYGDVLQDNFRRNNYMYRPSQYLKYIVDPTRIVSIDHYKFIPGGSVTSLLDECDHINVLLISVFTRSFYIQGHVYPTSVPLQDAMDRDLVHV